MKSKTSISISARLLEMIDAIPEKPARSEVIEEALILYFKTRKAQARDRKDVEILNRLSRDLNAEALDVLDFQDTPRLLRAAEED